MYYKTNAKMSFGKILTNQQHVFNHMNPMLQTMSYFNDSVHSHQ